MERTKLSGNSRAKRHFDRHPIGLLVLWLFILLAGISAWIKGFWLIGVLGVFALSLGIFFWWCSRRDTVKILKLHWYDDGRILLVEGRLQPQTDDSIGPDVFFHVSTGFALDTIARLPKGESIVLDYWRFFDRSVYRIASCVGRAEDNAKSKKSNTVRFRHQRRRQVAGDEHQLRLIRKG